MTVYERKMTLEYNWDEKPNDPVLHEKLMTELHSMGLSVVSKYRYRTVEWTEFGLQTVVDSSTIYEVLIDDAAAFTLSYSSEASQAVDGLIENGFNAVKREVTTTKEQEKWICPHGEWVFTDSLDIDAATSFANSPPQWDYNDDLSMTIGLRPARSGYTLDFTISYTTDSIQGKKKVEAQVVDTPATDMRLVIDTVTECFDLFGTMGTPTIDCVSYIRSETSAKCEPATIDKVMG